MSTYFKDENSGENSNDNNIFSKISTYSQAFNDKIQFYKTQRWGVVGFLGFIFLIRLIYTGGNFIKKIIQKFKKTKYNTK
jgi:hypothetical protein